MGSGTDTMCVDVSTQHARTFLLDLPPRADLSNFSLAWFEAVNLVCPTSLSEQDLDIGFTIHSA